MRIYTIGHSTRKFEEFLKILKQFNIEFVVDVRHFPSSKKFPWFSKEQLSNSLAKEGIKYYWFEELGGYRKAGYQNYMKTDEWKNGIKKLLELSERDRTVIMCAEILWWRCHRRYISNWLVDKGIKVIHIFDEKKLEEHDVNKHKDAKVFCDNQKKIDKFLKYKQNTKYFNAKFN